MTLWNVTARLAETLGAAGLACCLSACDSDTESTTNAGAIGSTDSGAPASLAPTSPSDAGRTRLGTPTHGGPGLVSPVSAPPGGGERGDVVDAGTDDLDSGTPAIASPTPVVHASGGTLVTLASGQSSPYVLTVDETSVYWADFGSGAADSDGAIMKVALDGSALTTLVPKQRWAAGIAVDKTSVYWTSVGGLHKVSLGGGTPTDLASSFSNDCITVGPTGVYGTNGSDSAVSASLDGSQSAVLGPGTDGSNTYGIAVDATSVYWTEFSNPGIVAKVSIQGGPTVRLAIGHVAEGIAVDATSVYWIDSGGQTPGALMKVSKHGGTPETLANGLAEPTGLAIDATNAYITIGFSSPSPGAILRVPLTGGSITVLADGQYQPSGIAVDATSVYWTTLSNGTVDPQAGAARGTIMKLTPK